MESYLPVVSLPAGRHGGAPAVVLSGGGAYGCQGRSTKRLPETNWCWIQVPGTLGKLTEVRLGRRSTRGSLPSLMATAVQGSTRGEHSVQNEGQRRRRKD